MAKVSIDSALSEITLRKYEPPKGLEKRNLIKKLCLSLGLLQPGDSRDVIVDVFQVILEQKKELVDLRIKTLEKQEGKIKSDAEELRKDIMGNLETK